MLRELKFIRAHFQPEGLIDYILIPWWALRWLFALCWYQIARIVAGKKRLWNGVFIGWGRCDDPTPVICYRCLWTGPRRWMIHTYTACGMDDVEPIDECPRCGYEG